MTCACKDSTTHSDSQLHYEQEQYLVDLLNRDYSEEGERTDAGQMKCKVGKPCNGRCIPQNHKCGAPGGVRSGAGGHPDTAVRNGAIVGAIAGIGGAFAHRAVKQNGGYEAVAKTAANEGLNVAEGTINNANRAAQATGSAAARTIGSAYGAVGKAAAPRSQKSEPMNKAVREANTKAAVAGLNTVTAAKTAANNTANKGQAYVNALRKKVNG